MNSHLLHYALMGASKNSSVFVYQNRSERVYIVSHDDSFNMVTVILETVTDRSGVYGPIIIPGDDIKDCGDFSRVTWADDSTIEINDHTLTQNDTLYTEGIYGDIELFMTSPNTVEGAICTLPDGSFLHRTALGIYVETVFSDDPNVRIFKRVPVGAHGFAQSALGYLQSFVKGAVIESNLVYSGEADCHDDIEDSGWGTGDLEGYLTDRYDTSSDDDDDDFDEDDFFDDDPDEDDDDFDEDEVDFLAGIDEDSDHPDHSDGGKDFFDHLIGAANRVLGNSQMKSKEVEDFLDTLKDVSPFRFISLDSSDR